MFLSSDTKEGYGYMNEPKPYLNKNDSKNKISMKNLKEQKVTIYTNKHWDWDTAQTPTGGSRGEFSTMDGSLME